MKSYYIYIMSSLGGTLYTGVTTDIWNRVLTHKQKRKTGFTKKYDVTRLVYVRRNSIHPEYLSTLKGNQRLEKK